MEKEDEEEVEEILSKPGSKRDYRLGFVIFYALTITLGSFQWGYTFTFYNVIVKTMEIVLGEVNHSDSLMAWETAMIPIGACVGALTAVFMVPLGRKKMLLVANLIFIIGGSITLVPHIAPILLGRILEGLAVGLFTVLCPLLIRETCPLELSGQLGALVMIQVTFGQFIAYLLGLIIPDGDTPLWRVIFAFPMIVAFIQFMLVLIFLKDSPKFFYMKRRIDQCEFALRQIYTDEMRIREEIAELKLVKQISEDSSEQISFGELFCGPFRKAMLIGLILTFFQQWSGVPGIYFYSTSIFTGVGDSLFSAQLSSLLLGLFNMIAGILSIFLIDKLGRKILLVTGPFCIAIFLMLAGIMEFFGHTKLSDSFTIVSVCFFQLSLGPVTWIYLAETLPDRGIGIVSINNWFWIICIAIIMPYLMDGVEAKGTYLIFMGMMFLCSLFCLILPETKDRTSTQIQALFMGKDFQPDYILDQ